MNCLQQPLHHHAEELELRAHPDPHGARDHHPQDDLLHSAAAAAAAAGQLRVAPGERGDEQADQQADQPPDQPADLLSPDEVDDDQAHHDPAAVILAKGPYLHDTCK